MKPFSIALWIVIFGFKLETQPRLARSPSFFAHFASFAVTKLWILTANCSNWANAGAPPASYSGAVAGTNVIANGGILNSTGAIFTGPTTIQAGGTLKGTGMVASVILLSGGVLAPGNSPGLLHITQALLMADTSMVEMEIASLAVFDEILVDGLLTYNGQLNITFLGGYTPGLGDTFDLFDPAFVAPDFDSIAFSSPGYGGNFNPGTGSFTFTAVPEPSTGAFLGFGLLALVAWGK